MKERLMNFDNWRELIIFGGVILIMLSPAIGCFINRKEVDDFDKK